MIIAVMIGLVSWVVFACAVIGDGILMRYRLRKIEKWIAHHDYQQNVQGLMGMGQAQLDAAMRQPHQGDK